MVKNKYNISLNEPFLKGKEKKYLMNCLKSNWVSSIGPYVKEFEDKFADYVNCRYAVACSSGTSALHLALLALGVGKNDLVIVPNLTFIATVNSVKYVNAEPVLIDVNENDGHLDLELLKKFLLDQCYIKDSRCVHKETQKIIKAIIPVHILGHALDMIKLKKIVKKYFIKIIEDAAEAVGASLKEKTIGSFGDIGCFSFNGNKIITTGSGGMIATNSKNLSNRIRHLSTQAKTSSTEFIHDQIGYNYRMSNIHSAIGLAQLEKISFYLSKKQKISSNYIKAFKNDKNLTWIKPINGVISSWWLFTLIIKGSNNIFAKDILKILHSKGIQARRLWRPINELKPYKNSLFLGNKVSLNFYKNCISLPSSANLKKDEQAFVIKTIQDLIKSKIK